MSEQPPMTGDCVKTYPWEIFCRERPQLSWQQEGNGSNCGETRALRGSGWKWSKRGWRPGRGGAPLPSPSGAVPIGPSVPIRDRPTKPFRAPPSPSEARQVAPIRAPTRPAPVRRHQAPCHELNQLTTLWKPSCGNHPVETIMVQQTTTDNNTAAAAGWSMK